MQPLESHPLIEDALAPWADSLGAARIPYRNHAYRVFNFSRRLLGVTSEDETLAVTSAFHDLGIWSDRTFDYLAPSEARAREYLERRLPNAPSALILAAIEHHHRLGAVSGASGAGLIDAFRRADLVDVSRGLFAFGLDRGFRREVLSLFPYEGFHGVLVRTGLAWFAKHPLRPVPVLRLSGARYEPPAEPARLPIASR